MKSNSILATEWHLFVSLYSSQENLVPGLNNLSISSLILSPQKN